MYNREKIEEIKLSRLIKNIDYIKVLKYNNVINEKCII